MATPALLALPGVMDAIAALRSGSALAAGAAARGKTRGARRVSQPGRVASSLLCVAVWKLKRPTVIACVDVDTRLSPSHQRRQVAALRSS